MNVANEVNLLAEYNQWVATRKAVLANSTPEEFMKDRLKEVAYDRIEQALDYIKSAKAQRPSSPVVSAADIQAILEGTYVEPDEGTEDTATVRTEPVEQPEAPRAEPKDYGTILY